MILAIDLDGVIHDHKNPVPGRTMGVPIEEAKSHLELFRARGDRIIVHTVKAWTENGTNAVKDWLAFYGIPFDEVTSLKPHADVYIDDKAIRFCTWEQTLNDIQMNFR